MHAQRPSDPSMLLKRARGYAEERRRTALLPDALRPFAPSRITWRRGPAPEGTEWAPSPPGALPVLGHMATMQLDPAAMLRQFIELRRRYGDVVRFEFGSLDTHLVSSPELIRQILQASHHDFSKLTRGVYKLRLVLGNGLLTSSGPSWLRNRRIAQPAFHRKRIASFAGTMGRCAGEMVQAWSDGEEPDIHEEMMKVTLRIIGLTMLSLDVTERADEIGSAVSFMIEDVNRRLNAPVDLPPPIPTPRNRALQASIETLDRVVLGAVERRRKEPAKNDLLGLFMDATDEETGEQMNDAQLRDEVMTIFLAGHETTANALSWALYLLGKHPLVTERLHAEVDEVFGEGDLFFAPMDEEARADALMEASKRLVYCEKVLKEAMRLYPPAWMTGRCPVGDQVLDGYHLPDGSLILTSPFIVHRHPEYWDNPEAFDPERFTPEREKARDRFAYFPFGGGPRICIGNHFAMLEAKLILAALALRFEAEPIREAELEPLITLRPKDGMPMRLRGRA
ncbi:MAG: cytochrome P450 [Myxococcota bacterium]